MTGVTNELISGVLKSLQQGLAELKAGQQDMKSELQAIRGHMLAFQADINNLLYFRSRTGRASRARRASPQSHR